MGDSYRATIEVWPWPDAERDALLGTVFAPLINALEDRGADFDANGDVAFYTGDEFGINEDHRGRVLHFETELNGGTLGFRTGRGFWDPATRELVEGDAITDLIAEIPWLAYTVWDEGSYGWTGEEFTWWPDMAVWPERSKLVKLLGRPVERVLDGSGGVVLNEWTYQQACRDFRGKALLHALDLYFLFEPRSYIPPPGTPIRLGEIPLLDQPVTA